MAREAKLIITSENKADQGVKSAISSLLGLDEAGKKLGSTLMGAFKVTAIIAAAKEIADFGLECTKEFGEVERTMIQLKTALGGSETSFSRMTSLIDDMAGKTLESKDSVEKLVAELASMGKSDADIERITQASVALSNVTGKDLNSSFALINATFTGSAGKLEKLIPEIGNLSKSQLAAGDAVDLLNAKFGAISNSMAGGIAQQFDNLKKSTDDFKEAIGANIAPAFAPMLEQIGKVIKGWADALDAHAKYKAALSKESAARTVDDKITIATEDLARATAQYKKALGEQGLDQGFASWHSRTGGTSTDFSGLVQEINDNYLGGIQSLERLLERLNREAKAEGDSKRGASGSSGAGVPPVYSDAPLGSPNWQPGYGNDGANWNWDTIAERLTQLRIGGELAGAQPSEYQSSLTDQLAQAEADRIQALLDNAVPSEFVDSLSDEVAMLQSSTTNLSSFRDHLSGLGSALKGSAISSLTSLGGNIGSLTQNIASMGGWVGVVVTLFQQVAGGITSVVGTLAESQLSQTFGILKVIGKLIGATILPTLQMATPLLEILSDAFLWLYNNAIVPLANGLIWVESVLVNAVIWTKNKLYSLWGGAQTAYINPSDNYISTISASDLAASGSSSSSSGASYTGASTIYFNFYNQGNVVGSGGLEELATLIDSIIRKNARYA